MISYEMYTTSGDAAVEAAVAHIQELAKDHTAVWNRDTLRTAAQPLIREVAAKYPEVTDTEPRNHIAAALDAICEANGWAYSQYDGYDLV